MALEVNPLPTPGRPGPRARFVSASTAALILIAATCVSACRREAPSDEVPSADAATSTAAVTRSVDRSGIISAEMAAELARIESREQEIASTLWADEIVAQQHGRAVDRFWDTFNASSNRWAVVQALSPGAIRLPHWASARELPHGIAVHEPGQPTPAPIDPATWQIQLRALQTNGWQLDRTEFRHNAFRAAADGLPARSEFGFTVHLSHPLSRERSIVDGPLTIEWGPPDTADGNPSIRSIDASRLTLKRRRDLNGLELILEEHVPTVRNSASIDPLIVADLDGDGRSEVLLAGANVVFRRDPTGSLHSEALFKHPPGPISTAVLGDFDGDGNPDVLVMKWQALVLYRGSASGSFEEPGRPAWSAPGNVRYPMALTGGDIDHDGDLDVYLAQYRVPYENGSMPTPFHDANDGLPAYLLLNDGHGRFADATETSGLGPKRLRRTYSASLVDLDGDSHLDLVAISDFSGVDLLQGDGRGHFTDRTKDWVQRPHGFGMGHAFTDFDGDGRLDFLMMGMTSATANRLEHQRKWREQPGVDARRRADMIHGSRLYLARAPAGFQEGAPGQSIAHSGWAWGCSAFDLDNDGFPEVYVANGLESRESVTDYESEYWLHDAFVGTSAENPTAYLYFRTKFARTRGRGQSYGGYDKNRLYLNHRGESFEEVGHLFGVALEEDSRNVLSDDLDGDGRMDLLVTHYEKWPDARQTLRIYRNTMTNAGHWIGFWFPRRPGWDPTGVRATLSFGNRETVRTIVAGDSHRSQHPAMLHFGLGQAAKVDRLRLQWPDGTRSEIVEPAINRYHSVP